MRALLAFDKFKDCMSASEACAVAAGALKKIHPDWEIEICPLSDGGDGFANILTQSRNGELIYATVNGPLFKPVEAHFGVVDCREFSLSRKAWLKLPDRGSVAVLEAAQASGLSLLQPDERNLWHTSSYGTGELLKLAIGLKPALIILGLGGSATHDLGVGVLEVLGLRFRAENGEVLSHITPQQWPRVAAIEGEIPRKNLPRIILAPNVQNKLLGPRGAAALFGAQKGLKKADEQRLEEATRHMAGILLNHFGASASILETPGSGAAGGMAVGLAAALRVEEIMGGIELADRWLHLNGRIERENVIITGEGKFDRGSLEGKAPEYVMEHAANRGKRIFCFVGQFVAGERGKLPAALRESKIQAIAPPGVSAEESMNNAVEYLTEAIKKTLGEV